MHKLKNGIEQKKKKKKKNWYREKCVNEDTDIRGLQDLTSAVERNEIISI